MAWIRCLRVCSNTVMTVSFERSVSGVEITTEKLHYYCCDPLLLHHYCLHPKSRTDSAEAAELAHGLNSPNGQCWSCWTCTWLEFTGQTVLKLLNLHMAWIRCLRVCSHTVTTVSFERSVSGVEITTEKLHYYCYDPLLLHHYCLHPKSRMDSLLSIHLLTIAVIRSWVITKWCRIQ